MASLNEYQRDGYFVEWFPVIKALAKKFPERFGDISALENAYRCLRGRPDRWGEPLPKHLQNKQSTEGTEKPTVAELKAKVELTFGELKQKQKLTREEYAKAANNFRELGTLLASLKAHSPDVFKGRFLAPNAEKFDFPFTYEKARQ